MRVKLFCKFIIILCWIGCGMCDDGRVPANSIFNQSTVVNQTRQAKCKRMQPHKTNANIYYRFFFVQPNFFLFSFCFVRLFVRLNVTKFLNWPLTETGWTEKKPTDRRVSILYDWTIPEYAVRRPKSVARYMRAERWMSICWWNRGRNVQFPASNLLCL